MPPEILEIAESSPMDFCLCGWGEEVHPDEFDTSNTLLLETSIVRADADPYIDPTADPTPPDAE